LAIPSQRLTANLQLSLPVFFSLVSYREAAAITKPNLTPQQLQVVDTPSNGATLTTAAAQAGVRRNSIANWRRNSNDFRQALARISHTGRNGRAG
jgi:hypothetical protein